MRDYGVPMFRNLDEPPKAQRVGVVLAIVAAVYLGITAIVVIGVMVDGPVNAVQVAAEPGTRTSTRPLENCLGVMSDIERRDCRDRNAAVQSGNRAAPVTGARPASLKEVPDWPMRIAISGGVLIVASFFFSIILGLAAIVARLSHTAPNPDETP